jgi:hypothetical protein
MFDPRVEEDPSFHSACAGRLSFMYKHNVMKTTAWGRVIAREEQKIVQALIVVLLLRNVDGASKLLVQHPHLHQLCTHCAGTLSESFL